MNQYFSKYYRNTSLVVIFIGLITLINSPLIIPKEILSAFIFHPALAQQFTNTTTTNNNGSHQQKDSTIAEASGHFANNQIKGGLVEWIQGGLWNLKIKNSHNNSIGIPNMTAIFNANFTMIKPDGSLSHNHIINNFSSNNVIFAGNDIIVTGVADIHSNIGMEFKHVPITVHLMGKKVLGLTIDVKKTNGHFASPNEMFGTLITGVGLDNSNMSKIK
ncbi:MAG TPA: hypothetical protein VN703_09345 [Candidatus Sulfopaludibacter sp.]|jgi:hypothetical protein|nr:hypothetical protein [Candidatus Sulfopaludibacter sp.]